MVINPLGVSDDDCALELFWELGCDMSLVLTIASLMVVVD